MLAGRERFAPLESDILRQWVTKHDARETQQSLASELQVAPSSKAGRLEFLRCFSGDNVNMKPFTMHLFGDSTMRNVYRALCSLSEPVVWDMVNGTSVSNATLKCSGKLGLRSTTFVYVPVPALQPSSFDEALESLGSPPDVLLISSGLWTLWPTPFHEWTSWPWYARWKHYERDLRAVIYNFFRARAIAPPLLMVANVHSICKQAPEKSLITGCARFRRVPEPAKPSMSCALGSVDCHALHLCRWQSQC